MAYMRALAGVAVAKTARQVTCPTSPEIVLIQDASKSLEPIHKEIASRVGELLKSWETTYEGEVRVGFASFTDKPVPLRGWGAIYATDWEAIDTCYELGAPLSTDVDSVLTAVENMKMRSGGDLPESQYEALMYAVLDPCMGFTQEHSRQFHDDQLVTRIAVVITDEISHVNGDAQAGIDQYNSPRAYEPGTYGGWGSPGLASYPAAVWRNETSPYTAEDYQEFWHLMYYQDMGVTLSVGEKSLLEYYSRMYEPSCWRDVIEHDGLYTGDSCTTKDYPSLLQVKQALDQADVLPIMLVTNPKNEISQEAIRACASDPSYELTPDGNGFVNSEDYARCVVDVYQAQFDQVGIHGLVLSFDKPEDVFETLNAAVISLSEYNCQVQEGTTTTEASTRSRPPLPTRGTIIPPQGAARRSKHHSK